MSEKRNIAKAAGVLGFATIISRILGMVRDMAVSRLFGAGLATDAFFAAFQIPNMLRRFFAEGALTSAFVPIFSEYYTRKGEEEARELANVCFTVLTIVLALIVLLGIIFSPFIVSLMFPGFQAKPGKIGVDGFFEPPDVSVYFLCQPGCALHGYSEYGAPFLYPGHIDGLSQPGDDFLCRFSAQSV